MARPSPWTPASPAAAERRQRPGSGRQRAAAAAAMGRWVVGGGRQRVAAAALGQWAAAAGRERRRRPLPLPPSQAPGSSTRCCGVVPPAGGRWLGGHAGTRHQQRSSFWVDLQRSGAAAAAAQLCEKWPLLAGCSHGVGRCTAGLVMTSGPRCSGAAGLLLQRCGFGPWAPRLDGGGSFAGSSFHQSILVKAGAGLTKTL